MSETLRAVALLLSLLLWSPVAAGLLRGEVTAERAAVLYAAALVLSLLGCGLLAHLVRAYAPQEEQARERAVDSPSPGSVAELPLPVGAPARRAEDAAG